MVCKHASMLEESQVLLLVSWPEKVESHADRPRSADDWGRFLNETLKTSEARLVVLAEGAIIEPGVCDDRHPAIVRMTEVARMNHVVIAAGSMVEVDPESPDHSWQTCPIIGKDGLIGSYRKRMRGAIDAKKAQEQEGPEIFSTPIGRLGVLICLDVEEDGLLFKTAQGCDIVINPAHIPYVGHGQWSHAMVPVQRRLQWWALACGVSSLFLACHLVGSAQFDRQQICVSRLVAWGFDVILQATSKFGIFFNSWGFDVLDWLGDLNPGFCRGGMGSVARSRCALCAAICGPRMAWAPPWWSPPARPLWPPRQGCALLTAGPP